MDIDRLMKIAGAVSGGALLASDRVSRMMIHKILRELRVYTTHVLCRSVPEARAPFAGVSGWPSPAKSCVSWHVLKWTAALNWVPWNEWGVYVA